MSEAPQRSDGWPEQLAAAFRAAEFDILVDPQPVVRLEWCGVPSQGTNP